MSSSSYYQQRIQQLEEIIRQLQTKTESMETTLTQLQNELCQLSNAPTTIEYKFDQLKIETLEGTLNIGLSPGTDGLDTIEELAVKNNESKTNSPNRNHTHPDSDLGEWINQGVNHYLNQEVLTDIKAVEQNLQYSLNPSQRQLVVEDIKKQMGGRLPHYINAMKAQTNQINPHQEVNRVMNQIKKDILSGIEIYINNERQQSQGGN